VVWNDARVMSAYLGVPEEAVEAADDAADTGVEAAAVAEGA
jgi:hypothetical protein